MSRHNRIVLVALAVTALSLLIAATALANAFSQVYQSYRKTGHVDPCRFSVALLNQAKAQVPPDIDQYAPDFPAALDAALSARARGGCGRATPQVTASVPAAATPATPAPPPPPATGASAGSSPSTAAPTPVPTASATPVAPASLAVAGHTSTSGGDGAPAAIIALAVLAGLLALAAGLWGLARWRGWDPPWLEHTAHAFSEAGVRAEATWAEFADWVRLGR